MKEDLKKILDRFDKSTIDYLKMNEGELFRTIAVGSPIPEAITETLVGIYAERHVITNAIYDLEKLEKNGKKESSNS